ncbi:MULTISPECIES: divalent-cation tolerance protein CutA [Streptomyces]|uniref:divalent-cation tolerance protein CutA n=1 Tax=Streptomyces TaxID=1883 RepID=UPI001BAF27FD|nr:MULTISPECIES: divalent-cation tolerance protein CutA [Streptomyces]MCQ4201094.1 divalent-cation tolerance protein CutA [Streptomyces coelicoflavus]QUW91607.1 Divalent-cation tolerance protein CutA [Streptomyces sp. V17-9]
MTEFVQVSTATPHREQAVALAQGAVRARLAAGAQITGPVVSVFWHLGEFGEGEEWRLQLTTTRDRYAELEKHLLGNHPWDNPEVIAVPIEGAARCLQWIKDSVEVL